MQQLHLFEAFGVELEYMLVDRDTLDIRPLSDQLLAALAGGEITSDAESGPITWSNELALHVVELKTTNPAKRLRSLPAQFETAIRDLRPHLEKLNLRLLPTGMHGWMNPATDAELWPHEYHEIYQRYHEIFDCRTHGWTNVQSVHLNLPFSGDEEFAKLHAAVRLVLPILPALAASSPIVEGTYSGRLDTRMHYYAGHCRAVPSLIGSLIPEPVYDEATYRSTILQRIYDDIRPYDSEGWLQHEFLNARGAIARFDRGSIELRVMDVQEYPGADVAICAAVIAVVKALVAQDWCSLEQQQVMPTERLRAILDIVTVEAEHAMISDADFLRLLVIDADRITARELWQQLLERLRSHDAALDSLSAPLEIIAEQGTLSTRIKTALGSTFTRDDLVNVYEQVADCLDLWEPFTP